jgi:glutaredoxin
VEKRNAPETWFMVWVAAGLVFTPGSTDPELKGGGPAIQLYQAEWCPFSHRVRAKLTELGVPYQAINVAAEGQERTEVEELTGGTAIPVLVGGVKWLPPYESLYS